MENTIQEQAGKLVASMTLEEKASLCSGADFWHLKTVERLGLPAIMVTDGPHGLRKQEIAADHLGAGGSVAATCFPPAATMASTWDPALITELGSALGKECLAEGVSVVLGPGVNIKRSPLCGRNFEYFSEDPFLSGQMALAHIQGVQAQGVGTSIKHFAVNNQEENRLFINAITDPRTLHEIYLAGFEQAIVAGKPETVMCAYNRLNGTYCSENPELLTKILRERWGFEGMVVSDWGAVSDRIKALQAGLDLEMPSSFGENDRRIVDAVLAGELSDEVLDAAATRITTLILKTSATLDSDPPSSYDQAKHHQLARRIAAEGCVLLRNEGKALPLAKNLRVAVIGDFAKNPRYQGAGSSLVRPTQLDNAYEAIESMISPAQITFAPGYTPDGFTIDLDLIDQACAFARDADAAVIFAGLPDAFESEGFDRTHLQLPASHNQLIERVAACNSRTIVVLSNGSPVEMPWAQKVSAILETYLGGQAGGSAVAQVLFGEVNPSGRLAETFPLQLSDTPCHGFFPGGAHIVEYREGLNVGYRYYTTAGKPVLYPFGHGLGYAEFHYTRMQVDRDDIAIPLDWDGGLGGEILSTVSVTVENRGMTVGKEVVQLYIRDTTGKAYRPDRELKGFAKVEIHPGEQMTVRIPLNARAFALYDPTQNTWVVESGLYEILVGSSVADIHFRQTVSVRSNSKAQCTYIAPTKGSPCFSKEAFEALLGRPIPPDEPESPVFTLDTPLRDVLQTQVGAQLYHGILANIAGMFGKSDDAKSDADRKKTARMFEHMVDGLPVRAVTMFSGGAIPLAALAEMVRMMEQERSA